MIKLCQRKQAGSSQLPLSAFLQRHSPAQQQQQQQRQQLGRGNGVVLLAATQLPARTGALALRARLSPAMSLFNRLEGFVLQLESSRDYFANWPDRICQRIRSASGSAGQAAAKSDGQQRQSNANQLAANAADEQQQQQQLQNGSAICWTGQSYGSYTKKLVEFGSTNMQDHPEVAIATPTKVNEMILNSIDRFRIINERLARHANQMASYAHFLTSRSRQATAAAAGVASRLGEPRRTVSDASGASNAPLRPQARVSGALGEPQFAAAGFKQQQLIDLPSAVALATSLPHPGHDEAADGLGGGGAGGLGADGEPSTNDSNLDEVSALAPADEGLTIDESTPSDEDEEEELAECPENGCSDLLDGAGQPPGGATNHVSEDQLSILQNSAPKLVDPSQAAPPFASDTIDHQNQHHHHHHHQQQQQQQHHFNPTFVMSTPASRQPTSKFSGIYTTQTMNPWNSNNMLSTAYEDPASGSAALVVNLLQLASLVVASSMWLLARTRGEICL